MPFTVSHAAAALPLLRTGLPASALVIGTMSPDLPYYLPLPLPLPAGWATHSAVGVVTVDLLLAAGAWALWHGLLVAPALAAAPTGLRARLVGCVAVGLRLRLSSAGQVFLVLLSLVVGAATHVLWDEFSHPGRWGTRHIALLEDEVGGLPGYRWVQYASGLVGGLALLAWGVGWWRRTAPEPAGPGRWWPWATLAATGLLAAVAGAATGETYRQAAFRAATQGGGAAVGAALLLALAWHLTRARGAPRPPAPH